MEEVNYTCSECDNNIKGFKVIKDNENKNYKASYYCIFCGVECHGVGDSFLTAVNNLLYEFDND